MIMLGAAAMILLLAHVPASDVPNTSIFRSGMVAMIALFGIAWMADTFIANNEDAIVRRSAASRRTGRSRSRSRSSSSPP